MNRILLNVKRFEQYGAECGLAAVASLANYYDSNISYETVRKLVPKSARDDGVFTSEQARLLNDLGFSKITIVTGDSDALDFSWRKLSKRGVIKKLGQSYKYWKRKSKKNSIYDSAVDYVEDLKDWLAKKDFDNQLIIDTDFAKYIRKSLNKERPVGACVNWHSLFKIPKDNDIWGDAEEHAIVIRGYDGKGIFVVDSQKNYRGKLSKYKGGKYKMSWDRFLCNIPQGDLILVG